MNSIDITKALLEELDFADAPGFRSEVPWPNNRSIPHISSAYFIQGIPVVYFSQLEEIDPAVLAQLYRSVWSQGKAALLYVISRQDILVFNGYDGPPSRDSSDEIFSNDEAHRHRLLHHLQSLYDIETARQEIADNLRDYRRILLDTGAFWQTEDGQHIDREKRADQRLLASMGQLRRLLLDANLPSEVAYALLGRSIFIRYLEDRGILTETWVAQITNGLARDYLTALDSKKVTYDELFDYLHQRFNGDIFPVNELERQVVSEGHLKLIQRFLQREDLETGQLSFWPYDFSCVPIELISGIYDTFLSDETRRRFGTYNTPLALVDFIVEETLPLEKTTPVKRENTVRNTWEEDTFTIQMETCINQLSRKYKSPLRAQTQRSIYTPEMMAGKVSPKKAVKIDIKIWDKNWDNEDDIYFTWECKLIVDKAREGKHDRLVREYITNGIVRFLDGNWKYAQAVEDAGILGYVLYGEVAQIVEAINQEMLEIPRRPESSSKDDLVRQALQAARKLSSSDQLKLCNPGPINDFIFYESRHRRHFCHQDIRLYHFFLTFDFAA